MITYTVTLFITLLCLLLSSTCKAVQDHISHRGGWPGHVFWSRESWKLKWKNGDPSQGERFWGSSRWFVALTDAWHLFDFLRDGFKLCAIGVSLVYAAFQTGENMIAPLVALTSMYFMSTAVFEHFYNKFNKRNLP